jgi:hypothetical protein
MEAVKYAESGCFKLIFFLKGYAQNNSDHEGNQKGEYVPEE